MRTHVHVQMHVCMHLAYADVRVYASTLLLSGAKVPVAAATSANPRRSSSNGSAPAATYLSLIHI